MAAKGNERVLIEPRGAARSRRGPHGGFLNPSWFSRWVLVCLVIFLDGKLLYADDEPPVTTAKQAAQKFQLRVMEILDRESNGLEADRAATLLWMLDAYPDTPKQELDMARYQAGRIRLGETWVSLNDVDNVPLEQPLQRYRDARGNIQLDAVGHRKMATWCTREGLLDEARAHWFGVLDESPNDAEARTRLGFQAYGPRWISPQESRMAHDDAKATVQSYREWMPRLREWVSKLEGDDTKARLKAIDQIRKVKDPNAIPSLLAACHQVSEDNGGHLIQAIGRFQTPQAATALALLATETPTSEIGNAAIEALRKYPQEFYIPSLLDAMSTEYALQQQVLSHGNGTIVLQSVQTRELRNHIEVGTLNKLVVLNNQAMRPATSERLNREFSLLEFTVPPVENALAKQISNEQMSQIAAANDRKVAESNEAVQAMQLRITSVLRATTLVDLRDDPKDWWAWWNSVQEVSGDGSKEVQATYLEDTNPIATLENVTVQSYFPSLRSAARHECLVAGTLVQTRTGLTPIEQIRIGDSVASMDVSTGELAWKPVSRITQRPPTQTRSIRFADGETIRSTLGHPWWVVGRGWTKSKDLKPDMAVRTASRIASIADLSDEPEAETYNLVVMDFHTYFVGRARLLSYDAGEVRPTFQKVPGLPAAPRFPE
jgi:hypothetical protein